MYVASTLCPPNEDHSAWKCTYTDWCFLLEDEVIVAWLICTESPLTPCSLQSGLPMPPLSSQTGLSLCEISHRNVIELNIGWKGWQVFRDVYTYFSFPSPFIFSWPVEGMWHLLKNMFFFFFFSSSQFQGLKERHFTEGASSSCLFCLGVRLLVACGSTLLLSARHESMSGQFWENKPTEFWERSMRYPDQTPLNNKCQSNDWKRIWGRQM